MRLKPQNARVELHEAHNDRLVLFIGDQCICLFDDGRVTYKRDYHNTQGETILYKNVYDLIIDKICFA